ncbi:MFS transporter [Streptomyces sp. Je 1-4]|uniref:MFS transporter n=1 Tax=Streptomyces TaxID=1883 RepID=UPI0021D96509|nr:MULTISPECIES: MFS transporter [unclassified Streptomyces]UYB41920.1 MFS transporter [Streptomyces sp. Je 1-4]UZQ38190.1 MFS transporter [Streptomyces sp. Je 1-4] [Streptomyces sp. Je 1-4 4N24]UZQ45607.1 MFS transporter [Streptomyces sp. Je 1-4] [Streptomyces sp. Je 1-4 4N24_ara]
MPKPEPHPHLGPQARWALAAVATGAFCVQLDSFALNLALPVVRDALHGSATVTPWVVSGYLLAAGSLMPVAGRLSDLYGRRRMLTAGLALFGVTAVLCALAPSLPLLVTARVLQGAGGALIMPAGLALLTHACPPGRGRRAMGRALGLAGLATVCGPFLGGVLARSVSWRAVFWLTVPLALAAGLCARRAAESRDPDAGQSLDHVGAIAATGVAACLARWLEHADWGWAAGAALFGALFVRAERRSSAPLVDLALFRNRPYVALTVAGAVANSATVALLYVVPWTLQQAEGWSVLEAGVVFVAPAGALAVGGPLAGRVRPGAAVPVMALCLASGAVALAATTRGTGTPALLMAATAAAAALGVAGGLALTGTQAVVRRERAGEASGVTKAVMTATAGVGLALTAAGTGGGARPSLVLPAAVCLATAAALVIARVLGVRLVVGLAPVLGRVLVRALVSVRAPLLVRALLPVGRRVTGTGTERANAERTDVERTDAERPDIQRTDAERASAKPPGTDQPDAERTDRCRTDRRE